MSGVILTRWAVAWETAVSADAIGADGRLSGPVLLRLFADGRRAYFGRCPSLLEELHGDRIRLQEEALRVDPTEPLGSVRSVLVAVSITELRPTSFDMAFRVRSLDRRLPRRQWARVAALRIHPHGGLVQDQQAGAMKQPDPEC